jgi:hypothetical protein
VSSTQVWSGEAARADTDGLVGLFATIRRGRATCETHGQGLRRSGHRPPSDIRNEGAGHSQPQLAGEGPLDWKNGTQAIHDGTQMPWPVCRVATACKDYDVHPGSPSNLLIRAGLDRLLERDVTCQ